MENEEMLAQEGMQPEEAGRSTDSVMGHLSLGEIVIPRAFVDDPQVMEMLQVLFQQNGQDIAEFTVGDQANKINPETGYAEFFKLGKLLKFAAPIALSLLAPGIGTALGSGILGAGAAGASTLGNALIGGGIGALTGGGLKGGLIGAASGGIGANIGGIGSEIQGPLQKGAAGLGNTGSGILGAVGDAIPGLRDATSGIGNSLSSLGDNLNSNLGLSEFSNPIGPTTNGSPLSSRVNTLGKGLAGISNNLPSIGGLTGGGGGGGSTFNIGSSLASGLGGIEQDSAIKKAQKQLLASNGAQLANLDTFDPSGITSDPGYQFRLDEGQKGLDRSLGAEGSLFSGKALKAASQYNQDYATNAFKDYYDRWLTKTSAQNQLLGNKGDIQANAGLASSQNIGQSLSGVLNPNSTSELLKLLQRRA